MPSDPTGDLTISTSTIERADISLAGATLLIKSGEAPPLSERAIRQRFSRLTTLLMTVLVLPAGFVGRLLLGPELMSNATVALVFGYGLGLLGTHLWARRSSGFGPSLALIGLLLVLPIGLALVNEAPAAKVAASVLLVAPVAAASSLLGHRQGAIIAALAILVAVLVHIAFVGHISDPELAAAATLWTVRVTMMIFVLAVIGWFFSSGLRQVIDALRGANRRLAARARRQGALAYLGQRALASVRSLVEATVNKVPTILGIDLCVYIERVDGEPGAWDATFPDSRRPRRIVIPEGPLHGALAGDFPDLVVLGDELGDERLRQTRCLVVPTTLSGGRRAALLACGREQAALGADEVPFLQTVLSLISAADRRQEAEALQSRSEARYAELVELSPDGIVTVDSGGRVTSCNPAAAAILGRSREELARQPFYESEILDPEDMREAVGRFRDVIEGRPMRPISLWVRRPDGSRRRIEVNGQATHAGEGTPAVIAMLRDVTERHHLEEQLRISQRLESLGLLAGGVAHDFNNILTVVITSAALLRDERLGADASELVEEIYGAGERAASLTRQLLAFSRRQVLSPRPLNLSQVVRDLEKMLRRLIGEDVELIVDVADDLGTVLTDRSQVEQALINLCVNARAAMPKGGILMITSRRVDIGEPIAELPQVSPGAYVHLKVSDTGVGMDRATQARIFEPFFTTKEPGEGTGLGLAMVHGFVQQSGGHIWAESEVERGTSFHVLLPIADEPAGASTAASSATLRRGQGRVMVIEDEPLVRTVATRILRNAGYEVIACDGPAAAIERFAEEEREGEIDLVISDVVMPGMNGVEVIKLLRLRRPSLRAIMVSGYPRLPPELADDLERLTLVQKPFTPEGLTSAVERALRERA
ncbi:MAG: PAS domain S-box protein [Myxococcales bacterium]|nr:PAS domain S-box protein [Myxococcales bacterium]